MRTRKTPSPIKRTTGASESIICIKTVHSSASKRVNSTQNPTTLFGNFDSDERDGCRQSVFSPNRYLPAVHFGAENAASLPQATAPNPPRSAQNRIARFRRIGRAATGKSVRAKRACLHEIARGLRGESGREVFRSR